jgi:hypothetical protein
VVVSFLIVVGLVLGVSLYIRHLREAKGPAQ